MEIIRNENTCLVKNSRSSNLIEAEVSQFIFEKQLDIVINKAIKLKLKWNGRCYEGFGSGMDFESAGPKITKTQTGTRG